MGIVRAHARLRLPGACCGLDGETLPGSRNTVPPTRPSSRSTTVDFPETWQPHPGQNASVREIRRYDVRSIALNPAFVSSSTGVMLDTAERRLMPLGPKSLSHHRWHREEESMKRSPYAGSSAYAWMPLVAALFALALPAQAEVCWDYTDFELAKVPLKCVRMGNPAMNCSWSPSCNTDLDPSDCCMAVHDPAATQTIGEMHVVWHNCLGNVGTSASPPPPNRGLRWFAFHRQFEWDFNVYRESLGLDKIDSLEWCPGMNMPYGHFGAGLLPGDHPLGCGTGINRPNNRTCDGCDTFRPCLYLNGAGPAGCPAPTTPVCSVGAVSFPYTSLDQFKNADEVATLLDVFFHGEMHGDVADADGGGYNADCASPNCSPRDPMFWRLHKALDDVMRAWQNIKAVDVTLVIDRSGSMSAASGTGVGTRLQNAVEAADMFADLLEEGRSDGGVNRLGIVSYSTNASVAALNMPLQDVTPTLRDAGGAFATTLAALSPGGATSIGSGVTAAIDQLCPGGSCATHVPAAGENERKAILLLTDGKENVAPCLQAGCQGGMGAEIDYNTLDVTQVCAVGLGNAASINGELLTIFAERQGGIYLNNTDASGNDLKDFFVKCFAQLTDEFVGLDPSGTLAAAEPAGPIVPYESCDDNRITFTAGWNRNQLPGDRLSLLVTSPNGDAWVPSAGYGEISNESTWAFKRSPLPYRGQSQGTWTMQLLRPQQAFVNGFTTDSFANFRQGQRIVRRQIQRLCPIGDDGKTSCNRVLYFEDGTRGRSVYAAALKAENGTTVAGFEMVKDAVALGERLRDTSWDLIVYARQAGPNRNERYDGPLAQLLCGGAKAIVTDTRSVSGAAGILRCAGALRDPKVVNLGSLQGSERFVNEVVKLRNPGHRVFSYGVRPTVSDNAGTALQARFTAEGTPGAIVGKAPRGSDLIWHKNVLVTGLSQLTAFAPRSAPRTGEPLKAAVRILPPFHRAGGYPGSKMTVEVERPTVGLGSLVKRAQGGGSVKDDPVSSLELQLGKLQIPTRRDVYELNDQGINGDVHRLNGTFSADLPISAAVDGMYTYYFRFEYPAGSCRAHRELKQTLFVNVNVNPKHSKLDVASPQPVDGGKVYPVSILPRDALGNVVGPGRLPRAVCAEPCGCDAAKVIDRGDGVYTIPLRVPDSVELASCSIDAFGARFAFGERPRYPDRDAAVQ
jgi:hypothetical protein